MGTTGLQLFGSQFSKHSRTLSHMRTRTCMRTISYTKVSLLFSLGKKHIRCGGDKKRNVTGEVGQKGRSFSCLHGNGPGRSGTHQSGQEKLWGCRDSLAGSQESRAPPQGRISSSEPGLQAEAGSGWFPSESPPLLEWHLDKPQRDQLPRSFLPQTQHEGCA